NALGVIGSLWVLLFFMFAFIPLLVCGLLTTCTVVYFGAGMISLIHTRNAVLQTHYCAFGFLLVPYLLVEDNWRILWKLACWNLPFLALPEEEILAGETGGKFSGGGVSGEF